MDNTGIVVDDILETLDFFPELGFELEAPAIADHRNAPVTLRPEGLLIGLAQELS